MHQHLQARGPAPAERGIGRGLLHRVAFGTLVVVATLAGGTIGESVWRRYITRQHPVRGVLVDVGGRSVQLDCRGQGTPVVVFESGLDNLGSFSWTAVHDEIARVTRACAYSRAGLLWSERAPGPFDAARVAGDLHRALRAAGEHAPFVMVGHSLGGPYVMDFTARFPQEVSGLVLVDASHPDQQARLARATGLPLSSMQPSALLLRSGALLARTGLIHLIPLPDAPTTWPSVARDLPNAFLSRSMAALRDEGLAVRAVFARTDHARDLNDRPMVVLTAARPDTDDELPALGMTRDQETRKRMEWIAMQREMSTWSHRGRQELVPNASHYIQFDRPDVVVRAVSEVVADVRATRPLVVHSGQVNVGSIKEGVR